MHLTVDLESPVPVYEQIRAQITEMVELGTLSSGAPLLSVPVSVIRCAPMGANVPVNMRSLTPRLVPALAQVIAASMVAMLVPYGPATLLSAPLMIGWISAQYTLQTWFCTAPVMS